MKKKIAVLVFLVVPWGFHFPAYAQFTPAELAERPQWEEFLKTAKIIGEKQLRGPEAVTKPWELTLEKDGVIRKALWKNPEGGWDSNREGWKWEIAAFRLDKYLGLNMVPPTVEKRRGKDRGSCQIWVDSWITLVPIFERKVEVPPDKESGILRAFYLQRAFDNLIANEDRHQRNYLITKDWRMILIDHSRSFRTSGEFAGTLIYDEFYKDGPLIMKELPRAFVEKLKSLSPILLKEIAGEYLTDKEIDCLLRRRDLILEWLEKRIKELGEDKVLY